VNPSTSSAIWTASSRVGARISTRVKPRSSGAGARLQHPVQDRQQERGGLAGAGVGAADEVVAAHDDRDDRALDRRRGREAADADPVEQRRFEPERVEATGAGIVIRLWPGDRRRGGWV
jgi:hypothetical protein